MGKGRFVNQKLGKVVHRGISQHLRKAKTQDWLKEAKRTPNHFRNAVKLNDDEKQGDGSNDTN